MEYKKWFRVRKAVAINGQVYRIGICYAVNAVNKDGVSQLVGQGLAEVFDKEVRIVSGKAYDVTSQELVTSKSVQRRHKIQADKKIVETRNVPKSIPGVKGDLKVITTPLSREEARQQKEEIQKSSLPEDMKIELGKDEEPKKEKKSKKSKVKEVKEEKKEEAKEDKVSF